VGGDCSLDLRRTPANPDEVQYSDVCPGVAEGNGRGENIG
jgi:hypothetical protein